MKKRGRSLCSTRSCRSSASAASTCRPKKTFVTITLDPSTLGTLETLATAVELKQPALLEGDTSTSKTSSIEYLAMITGNERQRLNLNGQSDTSELIGKFVPNDGRLQIQFEDLLRRVDLLNDASRAILERANAEGRGLTLIESEKIAEAEGIKVPDWRWQNGIVPEAMIRGQWVILDELNLADAAILERLNSVLERNPSLVVSENGGRRIGRGGDDETHPNFRIFGTMNPAKFEGRRPLSRAYKNRWTSYRFVQPPSENDYRSMLNHIVFGEQPEVELRGTKYRGELVDSLFPELATIPNFREFLARLAKFEVTVEGMSRKGEIGKNQKEPYTFTRRGLLEFLTYLGSKTITDRATGKKHSAVDDPKRFILRGLEYYYLNHIADPDDLKKVNDQLDLIGISERKWSIDFSRQQAPSSSAEAAAKKKEKVEFEFGDRVTPHRGPGIGLEGNVTEIAKDGRIRIQFKDGRSIVYAAEELTLLEKTSSAETESRTVFTVGDEVELQKHPKVEASWVGRRGTVTMVADGEIEITRGVVGLGGRMFRLTLAEAEEALRKVGEETPKIFTSISGARIVVTGETERGGYRVGELLEAKEGVSLGEINRAKEIRVVGFTAGGEVVNQLDGDKVLVDSPFTVGRFYRRAEKKEGAGIIYRHISGETLRTTGVKEIGGFAVGDILARRSGSADSREEVRRAREIRVVGFTADEKPVLLLDGGLCIADPLETTRKLFVISVVAERERPKTVTLMGGHTVELTEQTEHAGFKVGDQLSCIDRNVAEEISEAKEIRLVGFTASRDFVLQVVGGNFYTGELERLGTAYKKMVVEKIEHPAITLVNGTIVELSEQKEYRGIVVGDRLLPSKDARYLTEIMDAEDLRLVGFAGRLAVIQVGGSRNYTISAPDLNTHLLKAEEKKGEAPKSFTTISGSAIEVTAQKELNGFIVGDLLDIKDVSVPLNPKVRDAKERRLVGFAAGGNLVIQLDGGHCILSDTSRLGTVFVKAGAAEGAAEHEPGPTIVFARVDGGSVEVTREKERDGIRVGETFLPKWDAGLRSEVMMARTIRVVGFTEGKRVVIQLDGGKVVIHGAADLREKYRRIT